MHRTVVSTLSLRWEYSDNELQRDAWGNSDVRLAKVSNFYQFQFRIQWPQNMVAGAVFLLFLGRRDMTKKGELSSYTQVLNVGLDTLCPSHCCYYWQRAWHSAQPTTSTQVVTQSAYACDEERIHSQIKQSINTHETYMKFYSIHVYDKCTYIFMHSYT